LGVSIRPRLADDTIRICVGAQDFCRAPPGYICRIALSGVHYIAAEFLDTFSGDTNDVFERQECSDRLPEVGFME
jgi:hypothetical protein